MKAVELRLEGKSFTDIARELDYSSRTAAYNAVYNELKKRAKEPVDKLRMLELERLDALLVVIWKECLTGDEKKIETYLKIANRRAKLAGLDKQQVIEDNEGNEIPVFPLVGMVTTIKVDPNSGLKIDKPK
jgi:hypothetical protein